jgi:peptide/nickel transport system permease protein
VRNAAFVLLAAIGIAALGAPSFAPNGPEEEFRDFLHAPPMRIHIRDEAGNLRAPFVYRTRLVNRLEQRYEEDRATPVTLRWMTAAGIVDVSTEDRPLLLLGADSYGRDIWSRMLFGARASLAVAAIATLGALLVGLALGALAGYRGGAIDEILMRVSELVIVLPGIYLVLALRMVLPIVLTAGQVFVLMSAILALAGWPFVARGVRAIVQAERQRDYCAAAVSLGASGARVLTRHLLPASAGFLAVQITILLPAFILAEATLSYVGLGFPPQVPSWGAMLREESGATTLAEFPWTLAPAAGIFLVVLACNMLVQTSGADPTGASRRWFRSRGPVSP